MRQGEIATRIGFAAAGHCGAGETASDQRGFPYMGWTSNSGGNKWIYAKAEIFTYEVPAGVVLKQLEPSKKSGCFLSPRAFETAEDRGPR